MEFIETPTFSRMLHDLLPDEEFRYLQNLLVINPERGAVIRGSGGIRKLRFGIRDRGKSGGLRLIYYWKKEFQQIYLLVIYSKSKKDNLSSAETALLRKLVREI
jgi:hypothetical protein